MRSLKMLVPWVMVIATVGLAAWGLVVFNNMIVDDNNSKPRAEYMYPEFDHRGHHYIKFNIYNIVHDPDCEACER